MIHGLTFTNRLRFYVKCAGAIALLNFFLFTRFDFNVLWFLCALLVAIGAPLLYVWFTTVFGRTWDTTPRSKDPRAQRAEKFLPAAEDGVLLLPLMFVGINPFTALCAAVLYMIFRQRDQAPSYTVTLGAAYFVMALWVLPQGLWMVVAAHAVAALILDKLFPRWFEADTQDNPQRSATL